jgi:cold shock CspA family protein
MARSRESFGKKNVRTKKEKKRKEKEQKKQARKEGGADSFDDMIAYVDENGMISDTPPDPDKKEEISAEDIELGVPRKTDEEESDEPREGRVNYYNDSKGYGFITDKESRDSIFFHINNAIDEVEQGNIVNFKTEPGDRGMVATQIRIKE